MLVGMPVTGTERVLLAANLRPEDDVTCPPGKRTRDGLAAVVISLSLREWRNWQTRTVQVRVPVRAWGFKSPLAHQQLIASPASESANSQVKAPENSGAFTCGFGLALCGAARNGQASVLDELDDDIRAVSRPCDHARIVFVGAQGHSARGFGRLAELGMAGHEA